MQRALLNLVLLLVVIGVGTAAWLQYRKTSAPKAKLTAVSPEAVTKAEIAWPDAPVIQLARANATSPWTMVAPVAARVDGFEVLGVTSLAGTEVRETLSTDELDLKAIGLVPPERTVKLDGTVIEFGSVEPLEYRRVVRVDGKVMLIDDPASAALDRDYHDLVSKELLAPGEELAAIELPGAQRFVKGSDGKWTAETPAPAATPEAIAALAAAWKGAKSLYNEAGGPAPSGDRVRLTLGNGNPLEYVVAAREPQLSLYSEALKIRYTLSAELVGQLLALPEPAAAATAPAVSPVDGGAAAPAATAPAGLAPAAPSISDGLKLPSMPPAPTPAPAAAASSAPTPAPAR